MGFQTFERQNIAVGVGQDTRVDAQLMPGQVTQTVEVTAAASAVGYNQCRRQRNPGDANHCRSAPERPQLSKFAGRSAPASWPPQAAER